jgi:phthiodiolone/phenolphthiodiolone dimycocerosates ketoreductase
MAIVPAMWLPVLTGRSPGQIEEALESEVIRAGALNGPDEFFAEHGVRHPLGPGFSGGQDLLPQSWDEKEALALIESIPPSLMREMALVGTPTQVVEQAAEWRDCGVRYVVIVHMSPMQRSARRGLAAQLPFFKVIQGLKRL